MNDHAWLLAALWLIPAAALVIGVCLNRYRKGRHRKGWWR